MKTLLLLILPFFAIAQCDYDDPIIQDVCIYTTLNLSEDAKSIAYLDFQASDGGLENPSVADTHLAKLLEEVEERYNVVSYPERTAQGYTNLRSRDGIPFNVKYKIFEPGTIQNPTNRNRVEVSILVFFKHYN